MVAVVIAFRIRIILQRSLCQCLRSCIRGTGYAAVKLNSGFGQCVPCSHTDAAADQRVHLCRFQKTGQRPVTAAVGGYDLLRNNFAVFYIIKLELFGMAEMLEDFSIFIGCCNSHNVNSFLDNVLCSMIGEPIITAPNQQPLSVHQCISDFSPGTLVDGRHGRAGNAHLFGALLLGHSLPVKQADCLVLIQTQDDRLPV